VWMYPLGQTAGGVWDLAGNVWEWQANFQDRKNNWLALRGGSWLSSLRFARVEVRLSGPPDFDWLNHDGFRVVLPS
jgi:formylglycine-generating enzyme required for sulfatase activity